MGNSDNKMHKHEEGVNSAEPIYVTTLYTLTLILETLAKKLIFIPFYR